MDSMYSNSVWSLVETPKGVKPIGCKWIYKRKRGSDGKVETFKARLVAKGYTQKDGIDYDETFSPVAMLKSIRILLAVAASLDYEIWQMDVKTAFLNGNLEEDIYMRQPDGFTAKGQEHMVLKQLKDGTFISQIKYTRDLMKKFGMEEKSSVKIPMNTSVKMDMDADGKSVSNKIPSTYWIIALSNKTSGPDITFVVGVCARFQSAPKESHMISNAKRILRYLKGSQEVGLWYPKEGGFKLIGYSTRLSLDAEWTEKYFVHMSNAWKQTNFLV
ncbi:hypothetical protein DH2020_037954 [Rehmannia glutinosa]|uniref:Reverse transcriptase Ty1/copia-type domain-containing protein n=1 Tax=Rehmannia glutinosa TaxID=99300 RepID=A0ABR0V0N3_REHGL